MVLILNLVTVTTIIGLASGTVDNCSPKCSATDTSLYPHPKDCTKFYQCSYGEAFLKTCPSGLYFAPVKLYCDYPQTAGCTADPSYDCDAEKPTENPVTSFPPETTTVDDCFPPCPSPEALYPHPHDCTKFFKCAENVPYVISCPPGQEYSLELVRCDWPEVAKCTADPSKPCVAVTNPPKPSTEAPASVDPSCAPECPWSGAYMPHPQDCSKFYICNDMTPVVSNCPPGLEYNAQLVSCDYPSTANCTAGPTHACDELLM